MNFVYIDENTNWIPNSNIKPFDDDINHILNNVFKDNFDIQDANTLLNDIVIKEDSELTVAVLKSRCTLRNVLCLAVTPPNTEVQKFEDISSDVFILVPHSHPDGINEGMEFKIPYSYTKEAYLSREKISTVSNYTIPLGSTISLFLLSPFHQEVVNNELENFINDSVNIIHTNYRHNKGTTMANKYQVKYKKYSDKLYLGFEDIPLDSSDCDRDYNDIVVELSSNVSDTFMVAGDENITLNESDDSITSSSCLVQMSSSDISTNGTDASGTYELGDTFEYVQSLVNVSGGSRRSYVKNQDKVIWSEDDGTWMLRSNSDFLLSGDGYHPLNTSTTQNSTIVLYTPVINTVSGNVTSATNISDTVSGAEITSTNDGQSYVTRCSYDGSYEFNYIPDNIISHFSHIIRHYGFTDLYTNSINNIIPLSPKIEDPFFRIVLTWGQNPIDLDSHLVTEDNLHIYYANKNITSNGQTMSLDVDDVTSYGPETVTILEPSDNKYTYYVHNWSNDLTLSASSNVQVKVYKNNLLVYDKDIAGAVNWDNSSARYWHVFDIIDNNVVDVHEFKQSEPSIPSANIAYDIGGTLSASVGGGTNGTLSISQLPSSLVSAVSNMLDCQNINSDKSQTNNEVTFKFESADGNGSNISISGVPVGEYPISSPYYFKIPKDSFRSASVRNCVITTNNINLSGIVGATVSKSTGNYTETAFSMSSWVSNVKISIFPY